MGLERLQKILSRAGIASRRQAEQMILSGKILVNGETVRELGGKVDLSVDTVTVEGKPIQLSQAFHYYAYYKPRGVVVTKRDQWGNSTVFDRLGLAPEVNSVGRLDKESEGLLLLTDDGDFLQRYTHPSFQISKVYHVLISRELVAGELRRLKTGIPLEEKTVRAFHPRAWKDEDGLWLELELREGIKREIRRMLEYLGVKVLRLIRVRHGEIELDDLQPDQIREILI